eukprot:7221927-Pyramimonas_sp.AAC.1
MWASCVMTNGQLAATVAHWRIRYICWSWSETIGWSRAQASQTWGSSSSLTCPPSNTYLVFWRQSRE